MTDDKPPPVSGSNRPSRPEACTTPATPSASDSTQPQATACTAVADARATSSGPIAQELAKWLCEIRSRRTVPEQLEVEQKRFWAFGGSITWMFGFVLVLSTREPRFLNFIFANLISVSFTLALVVLYSLWFGWLLASSNRKVSRVRLFLDGLLLPTATVTIISIATGRVVQVPLNQSSPVTLPANTSAPAPAETGSEQPENPSAADPEASGQSPALPQEPENEEIGSDETLN